jgi:hypothetical protein
MLCKLTFTHGVIKASRTRVIEGGLILAALLAARSQLLLLLLLVVVSLTEAL